MQIGLQALASILHVDQLEHRTEIKYLKHNLGRHCRRDTNGTRSRSASSFLTFPPRKHLTKNASTIARGHSLVSILNFVD
jgi:hypothetical protein